MLVGGISSNTLTVTRGHGGTTAVVHSNGELVRLVKGNATATDDTVTLVDGSGLASDATVTTATVDSAAAFPSSGYIKIEDEIIEYTGNYFYNIYWINKRISYITTCPLMPITKR